MAKLKLKAAKQPEDNSQALIQAVLDKMHKDTVDTLAPDSGEFGDIAKATMAWWTLLFASGIFGKKRSKAVQRVIASSMLVIATIVKYTYALGVRRGQNMYAKESLLKGR